MRRLIVSIFALLMLSTAVHAKQTCFAGEAWRAWADADPERLFVSGDEKSILLQYTGPLDEDQQGNELPGQAVSFLKRIKVPPGQYRLLGDVKTGNSDDGWQLLIETGAGNVAPLLRRSIGPNKSSKLNEAITIGHGSVPTVKLRAVTHNKSWVIVSRVRMCKG